MNAHLLPLVAKPPPYDTLAGPLDDKDGAGGATDGAQAYCTGAAGDEAGDEAGGVVVGVLPVAITVTTLVLSNVVVVAHWKGQIKISSVTTAVTVVATRVYVPGVKVMGTGKTWKTLQQVGQKGSLFQTYGDSALTNDDRSWRNGRASAHRASIVTAISVCSRRQSGSGICNDGMSLGDRDRGGSDRIGAWCRACCYQWCWKSHL